MPTPRRLSLVDATLLVMGGIVGVGIFYKPGEVARLLPEGGAFAGAWCLGALAALAGAMTFAELAALLPREGGWFEFLREGLGRLPAFLFAWVVLLVVATGACAGVAEFCAGRLFLLFGAEGTDWGRTSLAVLLVWAITLLGCRGIKAGALVQNFCMGAKLLAIFLFVAIGLLFTLPASGSGALIPSGELSGRLVQATLPVLFTFGGWQLVTYIAPSVENPARTLPRAILLGVALVGLCYGLFNWACVRVLGMEVLANPKTDVAGALAAATLGGLGPRLLTLFMAISAAGFLVATLISTPGILVAMGRRGLFLEALGRVSERSGAPVRALLVQAAITTFWLVWSSDVKGKLGDSVVFVEWIFHGLAAVALLRLAKTQKERPWKSPFYPLFPLLYLSIAILVVLGNLLSSPPGTTMLGLFVLALGWLAWWIWNRRQPRHQ